MFASHTTQTIIITSPSCNLNIYKENVTIILARTVSAEIFKHWFNHVATTDSDFCARHVKFLYLCCQSTIGLWNTFKGILALVLPLKTVRTLLAEPDHCKCLYWVFFISSARSGKFNFHQSNLLKNFLLIPVLHAGIFFYIFLVWHPDRARQETQTKPKPEQNSKWNKDWVK